MKNIGGFIGLIIGVVLGFFSYSAFNVICEFFSCRGGMVVIIPLLIVIICFLIGWGLNVLIEKVFIKKRR